MYFYMETFGNDYGRGCNEVVKCSDTSSHRECDAVSAD